MGTRNLIIVIKNQEVKIAQYGNSSGYPEVVGLDILNFISIERNLIELTNRLSKICFMSEDDEKLYRSLENKMYEGNLEEMKKANEEISEKFPLVVMDFGGKLLKEIIICDYEKMILKNSINFAKNSLYCEWAYVIDLDKDIFEVYKGSNLLNLSENERFFFLQDKNEKYKPVKLIKCYNLKTLPNQLEFVEQF